MNTPAPRRNPGRTVGSAATGARPFSQRYPVWLCDVWGVVHNGVSAFAPALDCLKRHRRAGGTVVLITNAPRPSAAILPQLEALRVPDECYDGIVSSGDVTRALVAEWQGARAYHIGPERDLVLLDGLAIDWVGLDEADAVVCSGLVDDERETAQNYDNILQAMHRRDLEMICANPDKVVQRGDSLVPCAGALAERYGAMGGRVRMAGKPFSPIYDEALRLASKVLQRPLVDGDVLAIGDGLQTDAQGAQKNNLALLFITGGIHGGDMAEADEAAVAAAVKRAVPGVDLAGILPGLSWTGKERVEAN